ncbi:MAG: prolipoprotein diacylglyceryl transferase family protein [Anaerolineales bacterium]
MSVMIKCVPIAFYLPGDVPIYLFSLLMGLAAMIGLVGVAWKAPNGEAHRYVDAGLWSLVGALFGGRAGFVVINWEYFSAHLWESWQVYLGGFSWAGALGGGLVALGLTAWLSKAALGELALGMLPLLASLSIGSWLTCWLTGCAYGPPAGSWWGIPSRDEWGEVALRLPVQLIGALLTLSLFWLLDWGRGFFKSPGQAFSAALLGFSVIMLATSLIRADVLPEWLGMRVDIWAASAFTLFGGVCLLVSYFKEMGRERERTSE